MRRHHLYLFAVLFLFGFAATDNQDPRSFPKGRVLESLPSSSAVSLAGVQKHVRSLYSQRFTESAEGWILNDPWQLLNLPAGEGSTIVLASTSEQSYRAQSDSRSTGPRILLPEIRPSSQKLILEIREKYEIESLYDQGYLEISADDGASWTIVHGRSGKSGWCTTAVDISHFSGTAIRPAFRLSTDQSEEFSGWQIESITIRVEETAQLSASMVSLNAQGFPFIYMNVAVNAGSSVLAQSGFTVFENGVLQTNYFQVTPPQSGSGSRLCDIVFLMDNSGSMDDDQNAVRANVLQFVDNLAASGVDYALGLCRFGMSGTGNPVFENSGQLTQNADYFKNVIWARNSAYGSREPGYDAVVQSGSAFSFRPGAQKVFILITDEHPNQGSATASDVLNVCKTGSITLFVLTLSTYNSLYTSITSATNGAIFDIHSNFNTILQFISSRVSNNYVVQYRSSNPVADGIERRVEVRINWNSEQASVYGSYIPGAVPEIIRTAATIALEQRAWAANSTLMIEVEARDLFAPYVSTVRLYYRTTGIANYQSVLLNQVSSTLWRGQIPASAVNAPGVDYYLTASDGITTVSAPGVNPVDWPYQIAILPNMAPEIDHTPIALASRGLPVTVNIEARDVTNRLASILLYYKRTGQLTYQTGTFVPVSGSTYRCTIPAEYVTAGGVDYFIKAWDDLGVSSSHGTFDQPHYIAISGSGSWQPLLLDPVDGKTGMGAEVWLSWEASTGASGYRIEVDDNADFSSLDFYRNNEGETRVYVDGLDYESKYYWRVRAKNSQSTSPWSQVFSFTTMSEPPVKVNYPDQFVLAYLQDGDQCYTDRNYMLAGVPTALRYNLHIKTANDSKGYTRLDYISFDLTQPATVYIAYDERASSPPDWLSSSFTRTSKKMDINELTGAITPMGIWRKNLEPGSHFLGGNLAAGAAGAKTGFLVLFSFGFDPFTPLQIVSPPDSAKYIPVNPTRFVWRKIPGALWHDINVATAKSNSKVIAYDFGLTDTTYQVNNLMLGQTYYWRLRASGKDRSTDWTNWFKFTTGTPPSMTGIAIVGPAEIRASSSSEYICVLSYSDGSSRMVTDSTIWTDNSNHAEFTGPGRLTTAAVSTDKNITLSAQYAGLTASLAVRIKYAPIPIVFIPGIMGSPLYNDINSDDHLSAPGEWIWADYEKAKAEVLRQDFLKVLQLDDSGENPLNPGDHIRVAPLRGDGGNTLSDNLNRAPLNYYKGFFQFLQNVGYSIDPTDSMTPPPATSLFCYTYDWRKSLFWNGERLSAFIDQVLAWTNADKVNVIAHSMGGLVAKSCIKDFETGRINKLIFIGTPHQGAPKIYYAMLSGDIEAGFWQDIGLSNSTLKEIMRNMPSTYQLFPSYQYYNSAIGTGGSDADAYTTSLIKNYAYLPLPWLEFLDWNGANQLFKGLEKSGQDLYNHDLIDLATAVQNDLRNVDYGGIQIFNIVGTGSATIGHVMVRYTLLGRDHLPFYTLDGDGTVPLKSAEMVNGAVFDPARTFYIQGVEHTDLASAAEVMMVLMGLLSEPAELYPHPRPEQYSYAKSDLWQTIIACPVIVHVYDHRGMHTGPVPGGGYEEKIPGSRYIPALLEDPESKKIFLLPAGGTYRFEIISQDTTGDFRFDAAEIIRGGVRSTLSFENVHFGPSTKAYCDLTEISSKVSMRVDLEGDGSIDMTYKAAEKLLTAVGADADATGITDYGMSQNYPNPFNAATMIHFSLPREENVVITLFNISGQKITTLLDQRMNAGHHQVLLDGSDLATGVYLCQLTAGSFSKSIKIALLR